MTRKTKTVKSVEVLLSPQLRKDTRWSRAVQKAVVGSMQEWFVTVDRRKLEHALRGLLAVARIHFTDVAYRRSSRVRRGNKMLAEIGFKEGKKTRR